ncbi:MAG: DUF1553 domain-containing protein [Acidobacteria bacterium]|nr:DUF1553 domain-containing protein [Acidobacteriota bacterium]
MKRAVSIPVFLITGAGLCSGQSLYQDHIRPVLEKQCHACHNATTKQSGLDLTAREKMLRGGDRGPAVVPGSVEESLLYAYITHRKQPGMPVGGKKLDDAVIGRFAEWIKAGARFDDGRTGPAAPTHWSFRKPEQAPVPKVRDAAWSRNPVDAFLAAEHARRGVSPLGEADRHTLLRRVSLDLTGLPPAPAQVRAFLADTQPGAYERAVDTLLSSAAYGERWGRHWMDIWRYSDWYGSGTAEVRSSQRHIWQWRDWIIESLNEDKSYSRMVEEMLAGDEIAPTDPKTLRATGFLARNWYRFNRNVWLVDTIESTTAAFLGVTLKCARCHDHKYDPFPQTDYYRFRAFFEPHDVRIDKLPGQPDRKKGGMPRAYDSEPKDASPDLDGGSNLMPQIFGKTYLFVRGDENNPDKEQEMLPGTPAVLGGPPVRIEPVELPVEAFYPDVRPFVAGDLLAGARTQISDTEKRLARIRQEIEEARAELASPRKEPEGPAVDFAKEIKPVLEERCSSCHLGRNSRGGLSLGSEQTIKTGGKGGSAVVAGKSGESLLIQFLKGEKQPRMPLNGAALSGDQIALIARWIDRMPRKKPEDVVKDGPFNIAVTEKELASAKASLVALEARIRAEHAKYAKPPAANLEELVAAARTAEREANLLKADENVFRAQHRMAESREKNAASAKRDLQTALDALNKPADAYSPLGPVHPKVSSGRRLALARWITSPENPLSARVAVNHIWLRHFGAPLVSNVIDFGKNGKPPVNQALLDWLAVEFVKSGWSMKKLHRMLVTSKAYRMESGLPAADHANLKLDPNNVSLWRMNSRRLEAEVIRDSLLAVSGSLDPKMGGPELHEETDQDTPRRSLYFHITPSAQLQFLKVFDGADPLACYARTQSIVPQQALALANSKLSFEQAGILAAKLGGVEAAAEQFVRDAFLAVLARPVSEAERSKSMAYLERQSAASGARKARESLVHALFNRDEFVNIR